MSINKKKTTNSDITSFFFELLIDLLINLILNKITIQVSQN
jgi:hypothetical protein